MVVKKRKTTSERKKSGPLSKEECRNIEDWIATMDVLDIAQRLNRPIKIVEKYKMEFLAKAPRIIAKRSETEEFRRELHSSSDWPLLKQQYTHLELVFYENKYIEYRRHFKEMTSLELTQLHQLINLDVFMQRHNIERKTTQDNIDMWTKEIDKLYKQDFNSLGADEKMRLTQLETLLASAKATTKDKTTEYSGLLSKSTDIMKSLKSTRDQRIKSNQDQGKFMSILYDLEIQSRRQAVSFENALHEMAKQKELERLSQPHRFGDGAIDQPILSWETNNEEFD
jgi:hypothetical protein